VELGPGSGEKLAILAAAMGRELKQVHLVDVSKAALDVAAASIAQASRAAISKHVTNFEAGIETVVRSKGLAGPILVAFLGSTIGNYEPDAAKDLIVQLGRHLGPDDRLLVGADLVKPVSDLQLAYDDPLGITAAFNKNLLVRINRELDADFKLERFQHRAIWNASASRVEMHLESVVAHRVRLRGPGISVGFQRGESIWTESSYKFSPATLRALGAAAGLEAVDQWLDRRDRFALTLYRTRVLGAVHK
jgi:dimethylhistidine N-methyltransferase